MKLFLGLLWLASNYSSSVMNPDSSKYEHVTMLSVKQWLADI